MVVAEMPDLDAAMARLDAAEAAEPPMPAPSTPAQAEPTPQQPVAPDTTKSDPKPDSLPTDTPAGAKPAPTEPVDTQTQKNNTYAKDKIRRDDSWKALNAAKTSLAQEQATFKASQDLFQREREQFTQRQAKQTQKFTPEQYEQAASEKMNQAGQYDILADGLDARAAKLEEAGDYVNAEKAKAQAKEQREEAAAQRALSRQMKGMADNIRRNPDPTTEQLKLKNQTAMRDYTLKAAEQWPDVAKNGSEFQKVMAGHLKAAADQGMSPEDYPVIMYHAARLTAAEMASARVPGMEKELGELRAKVKELEALTAPGGATSSATSLPAKGPKSEEEEFDELRSVALQRS